MDNQTCGGGSFLRVTDEVYVLDSSEGNYVHVILGEETILVNTGRPKNGEGIFK